MEFLYGCGFFLDLLFIVAPTLTPPQQGLLSTKSIEDLLLVNPFLSLSSAEEVLRITFVFIYPFERMNGSCARLFISLKEREEGRKEGRFSRRFIDTDASIDRWGGGVCTPRYSRTTTTTHQSRVNSPLQPHRLLLPMRRGLDIPSRVDRIGSLPEERRGEGEGKGNNVSAFCFSSRLFHSNRITSPALKKITLLDFFSSIRRRDQEKINAAEINN